MLKVQYTLTPVENINTRNRRLSLFNYRLINWNLNYVFNSSPLRLLTMKAHNTNTNSNAADKMVASDAVAKDNDLENYNDTASSSSSFTSTTTGSTVIDSGETRRTSTSRLFRVADDTDDTACVRRGKVVGRKGFIRQIDFTPPSKRLGTFLDEYWGAAAAGERSSDHNSQKGQKEAAEYSSHRIEPSRTKTNHGQSIAVNNDESPLSSSTRKKPVESDGGVGARRGWWSSVPKFVLCLSAIVHGCAIVHLFRTQRALSRALETATRSSLSSRSTLLLSDQNVAELAVSETSPPERRVVDAFESDDGRPSRCDDNDFARTTRSSVDFTSAVNERTLSVRLSGLSSSNDTPLVRVTVDDVVLLDDVPVVGVVAADHRRASDDRDEDVELSVDVASASSDSDRRRNHRVARGFRQKSLT